MFYHSFPLRSAFLALPLEGKSKWQFQALQEELKPYQDILAFQNPRSPHLTLQFWRELMEIEYHQVCDQVQKIAVAASPFILKIEGVGTFGSRGENRVLFLTVPFSEELARLKKKCPWPFLEPFSPHITLARIRHPQRFTVVKKKVMKLLGGISLEVQVDRLRLYADVQGIKQTSIGEYAFGEETNKKR